jgi:DNA primase
MRPIKKYPIAPIFRALGGECSDYRTGRQKVRCPFHGDTRPSASIDFEKARFVCFACGVSGDAIDLLRTQEGLSWDAAVERAEALAGGAGGPVRRCPT